MSGVVEETPGRLEYEVALYKEAPPIGRISANLASLNAHLKNQTKQSHDLMNQNELPVDQAVPIGTKLQLRARISSQSVWKFVKLMEVTVSTQTIKIGLCSKEEFQFFHTLSNRFHPIQMIRIHWDRWHWLKTAVETETSHRLFPTNRPDTVNDRMKYFSILKHSC